MVLEIKTVIGFGKEEEPVAILAADNILGLDLSGWYRGIGVSTFSVCMLDITQGKRMKY